MRVSIVICTRNRCDSLNETLHCLGAVLIPSGMSVELLVVDNGSEDKTREVLQTAILPNLKVRHCLELQPGLSVARNTGMRVAGGEYIVFTDDDVRPRSTWLQAIMEPLVDARFDAVVGTVRIAPHLIRPWMRDKHLGWLASTHYLNPNEPASAVGANMAFSRRVLDRVPCFDPELGAGRLGSWEEVLFWYQLKQAGYKLGMAADAIVEHHFEESRLTRRSFLGSAVGHGRSQAHIFWHWEHQSRPFPLLRATRRQLQLCVQRMLRARECREMEGMPVWEMKLVATIAFLQHLSRLQGNPRVYEKYGTRRILP